MIKYQCKTCGKVFRPDKHEICPRCGDAVSAAILSRLERERTEARFLAEEREGHDPNCHEDDAWSGSYGDKNYHRTPNRNTGGHYEVHSAYAAHASGDHPTRVSNANPNRVSNANPTRVSNANPNRSQASNQQARQDPAVVKLVSTVVRVITFIFFLVFLINFLRVLFMG